jgi:hypothetical protein
MGTMKKSDTHAAPWKRMAQRWKKYYTPPGRPSEAAIRFYRKFAQLAFRRLKGKRPRVLILGSTPELRDLMFELKADVTTVDFNKDMISGLRAHMRHKGLAKEKHIIANRFRVHAMKNSGHAALASPSGFSHAFFMVGIDPTAFTIVVR